MAIKPQLKTSEIVTIKGSRHFGPALAHEQLPVTTIESVTTYRLCALG